MFHPPAHFVSSVLLASVSAAALSVSVHAEEDAPDIEEIIIVSDKYQSDRTASATKTPTPLLDIPQSLSVLSKTQIADQALNDIGDILRFTPGASVGQGEGHRDQITIRGQNTTADFFLDGLRDDVQYFRPLYNLERVEILRGANALIFGRGGGGGVINRVTKAPILDDQFTALNAGVDTFGSYLIAADTNIPTGENAGFRLNAFYEDLNNHRDVFGGERFAVNPTFLTKLGDATSLLLSYEYVDDDRTVDRGVPALDGEPLRGFDTTFFGDPEANVTTFQGHTARARLDHEVSQAVSLNATVLYANYDKLYQNLFPTAFDAGANTVTLDGYLDTTDRENLIIQTNMVALFETGGLSHTLLVGAEYGDQQTQNARRDVVFQDNPDSIDDRSDLTTFMFSDPLAIPAFDFPELNRDRDSDVEFFSLYLQDQIDIGDHFKVIGGLRYDRFEIDVVNGPDDGSPGTFTRVDNEVSLRLGTIYKPVEAVSIYTSYSRSFLPRSGDQFLTLTASSEALEPEKFDNYELGVKWDILSGLSFTASIFRLDRDNGTTVNPEDVATTSLISSRTEGLELQLVGDVIPGWWTLTAGYSYLDADERREAGDPREERTLSQVPEHMASIWNRITINDKLGVGFGATYQDAQFASISNEVELPDFIRFDAAVFYELTEGVRVQLNVENLFNTDYFPAAHNDNNISTGEPLNARITLQTRF